MHHSKYTSLLLLALLGVHGCSSYQPTKDVWKGTKHLWYTYASPPASVDYDDKGDLSAGSARLAQSMLAIDNELTRLERLMLNADRPPSQEWISDVLVRFPWLNGIAGVKYDGTILGHEPANSMKELDFIPLLYEDAKQRRSALRGDVQVTPLGPEVLLAAPLYESSDFLGVICVHFDMRNLATQAANVDKLVILSPYGLLWAGEYDFAQTPLAGLDWAKICRESSSGVCNNSHGNFLYQVRYLGNLPLVFAVAENDNFPKGNGSVEQGLAFFPKDRAKLPPPPQPERKERSDKGVPAFVKTEEPAPEQQMAAPAVPVESGRNAEEIQQGSQRSPLLRRGEPRRRRTQVRERALEGDNIIIERAPRPTKPVQVKPDLELGPDVGGPKLPGGRPSPFGATKPDAGATGSGKEAPASPEAPKTPSVQERQTPETPMLPGGRPSPFGSQSSTPKSPAEPAVSAPEGKPESKPDAKPETKPEAKPEAKPETKPEAKPAATPEAKPAESAPATLPGGRPSPFGS